VIIKGKVYNKRPYVDKHKQNVTNILFIEIEKAIQINGDMIKLIPILSQFSANYCVGEQIEADGEIKFENITTPTGKPCFLPIPVLIPKFMDKIN
jgi:hypothetical protein